MPMCFPHAQSTADLRVQMLHIEEEGREMIVPEKRPEPRSGLFSPSRPFSFSWVLAVQLFQMPLRG